MASGPVGDIASNENWAPCPKCGAPVLVDRNTGEIEKCARCDPHAMGLALVARGTFLLFGLIIVVLLVAIAIWMLL